MSDQELIILCRQNDRKAQQCLFDMYKRKVMGICLRYTSKPEADDILQESFIKIFDSLSKHGALEIRSLAAWINRIVINTAINAYQRKKELGRLDDSMEREPDTSSISGLENLQTEDLLAIIQKMPQGYRIVFNLYVIEGLDHREIAEELKINESASRSQLSRAKDWLKQKLGDKKVAA